ncbi:riboflavin synthase [Microscilla marina]|uniref:Riboflavin synthase n=1 Tax=Microscilla marina ATCC 23134 TaxID=313606 RepID=A1ZKV1_MICM2|nr:riboflavin synthase [Microscilla marina]EAY28917.1 riboflavin synthase, alpha subunit [Microscilla marina ATCC 23134]
MFTGIIETLGEVKAIENEGSNYIFTLHSTFTSELKIDQSVAHNGVCLTVTDIEGDLYKVTAIDETLQKTNLGQWKVGTLVNLERSMLMNARLDGHIVQGHVDKVGTCVQKEEKDGSWVFTFEYPKSEDASYQVTVEKGSICINGVSLTVFNSKDTGFSVAIIPYTYEHTNFKTLEPNHQVNLEFDIIGKYVQRLVSQYSQ